MKTKNLEKAMNELNETGSFKFVIDGDRIYDETEEYYIHYLETMNCLAHDCAEEFHTKFVPETTDKVFEKLEEAWKKDGGDYLEWCDNVAMTLVK